MNKFRTPEMRFLIERLRNEARRAAKGEQLGTVQPIESTLTDAADTLAAAYDYFCAVEGALA